MLGEQVEIKDILRLALDGHLTLSVNFVNKTSGRLGRIVGIEDVEFYEFPPGPLLGYFHEVEFGEKTRLAKDLFIEEGKFLKLDKEVVSIEGVWDLMMVGAETLDVEHFYQQLTGGPEITLTNLEGVLVANGDRVCQLQESFDENEFQPGSEARGKALRRQMEDGKLSQEEASQKLAEYQKQRTEYLDKRRSRPREEDYCPRGALPNDAPYVVRTSAILDFLDKVSSGPSNRRESLSTKERHTYLVLIAALCKTSKIDLSVRGVSSALAALTDQHGTPISDDTIRKIIKEVPGALESRSKP